MTDTAAIIDGRTTKQDVRPAIIALSVDRRKGMRRMPDTDRFRPVRQPITTIVRDELVVTSSSANHGGARENGSIT